MDQVGDDLIHLLHVTSFGSAFVVGPLWFPFFLATVLISRNSRIIPRWITYFAATYGVINLAATAGMFALTGPIKAMNGVITVIIPTDTVAVWLPSLGAWLLVEQAERKLAKV